MSWSASDPPTFESGSLAPVATYLLSIAVLSGLLYVSPGASPPPLLGMAWGGFLVALAAGALAIEGVAPRSVLSPARTLLPAIAVLAAFWLLYNLVASALAAGGVTGFDATWSRVAAHPLPYVAALLSSLCFTAIPEELVFRSYLQEKVTAMASGGGTRRAIVAGVGVVAVLFALFHLPRWVLGVAHGGGATLASRLLGLTLLGLAYGSVYALTRNVWLVALCHATMNQPPLFVTVNVPPELHLVVGIVEYTVLVSIVYLAVRVTDPDGTVPALSRRETAASRSD